MVMRNRSLVPHSQIEGDTHELKKNKNIYDGS